MPLFTYHAFDSRGREAAGVLDAAGEAQAVGVLKSRGLCPVRLAPAPASASGPGKSTGIASVRLAGWGSRLRWAVPGLAPVSVRELALFTRQMATLLRAGMPLLRGLETLARQERNDFLQDILHALADDIRSGRALSEAMARHPQLFDRLYLNMVRAGEAGGVLEVVLDRLARLQEKMLQLRGKVKAALIYPAAVMTLAVAIVAGLLVFVVPKFQQIFADLLKGAPLPPLTRGLLAVSESVKGHALVALAVAAVAWMAWQYLRGTAAGGRLVDGLLLHFPVVGDLLRKSVVAQFGRTFGTLLASGVPILRALAIAQETCANRRVAGGIAAVHDRVKAGEPVAAPLERTGVFPPLVTSMIDVGEYTGQLPEMLGRIADIYEDEVDNAVAGLSSLIEPVLIVFLAGVVGTIVIALLLPIIRIVQLLS